jgi:DHA2 family multidrug resistance protein
MVADQLITRSTTTKWLITATVMLVAVMEVLDITIVNVSLRDMMGTFGATVSQITWVVTAYVVASAIIMPLTGFLVDNIGRKKLLMTNIVGFGITSVLCGFSTNLTEIIIFRALQGAFGAALIPLSQYILRDTFPREELGKAMAVWSMGILVGPILGPTLGGYITENLSWHWVFFINIPVCVLAFVLASNLITESEIKPQPIDWLALIFLAVGIGCLQTFIEEGSRNDWLHSNYILTLIVTSVFCIIAFIIRCADNPHSLVNLSLFKDQQFTVCTLILMFYCMALFGALVLQPLMIEVLMNYPPDQAGLVMAPRGIAALLTMPFTPLLIKWFNAKRVIVLGLLVTAFGTYCMSGWNLEVNMETMAWTGVIQGIGMGLTFSPLSTIVFATLHPKHIASAAGMFSFGRSLGLSIGVAALSTILVEQTQINWNRLGGHINNFNPNLQHWLQTQNLQMTDPTVPMQLGKLLYTHANIIAYLDSYWLTTLGFLAIIPLIFLVKVSRMTNMEMGAH